MNDPKGSYANCWEVNIHFMLINSLDYSVGMGCCFA